MCAMLCIEAGESIPEMIDWTDFPHPRQREKRKSGIMRLSNASPFEGSAREESAKGARQVKKTG